MTPSCGGFTFAERPEVEAPDARIIWHADFDPGTLHVVAVHADPFDPDALQPALLAPWLTVAQSTDRMEHAVLSDGWHHIRLDIEAGTLAGVDPILLHYRLRGVNSAQLKVLPLRRFLHLCRHRRFSRSLFPSDTHVARGIVLLRVHDALAAGATQAEIARTLFESLSVENDRDRPSESLRSRVRRLVTDARAMARGGYRMLMRGAH